MTVAGQVDDLLRSGLNYVYGSHWDEFAEGFGARVIVEGVGILITYNDEVIKIAVGAFSGLPIDNGLVQCVADICIGTRIGDFYLSRECDGDTWCLIYAIKLPKVWLDPSSKASAQMLADSLANTSALVNSRAQYISGNTGTPYSRWSTSSNMWWFALLDHF